MTRRSSATWQADVPGGSFPNSCFRLALEAAAGCMRTRTAKSTWSTAIATWRARNTMRASGFAHGPGSPISIRTICVGPPHRDGGARRAALYRRARPQSHGPHGDECLRPYSYSMEKMAAVRKLGAFVDRMATRHRTHARQDAFSRGHLSDSRVRREAARAGASPAGSSAVHRSPSL